MLFVGCMNGASWYSWRFGLFRFVGVFSVGGSCALVVASVRSSAAFEGVFNVLWWARACVCGFLDLSLV